MKRQKAYQCKWHGSDSTIGACLFCVMGVKKSRKTSQKRPVKRSCTPIRKGV